MKTRAPERNRTSRRKTSTLSCRIDLPVGYRKGDVLAFHRRDTEQISERINGNVLQKGVAWDGKPACLTFRFEADYVQVELAIDGAAVDQERLERMAWRMLGLTQAVEKFERSYQTHPQIGSLIARNSGLRVPLATTPFEALSWAITGQQISVSAAVSIRRKVIQAAGLRHSSGLWCFPDSRQMASMSEAKLRAAGQSLAKAQTLIALSKRIEAGLLPLNDWADTPPVEEIQSALLGIKGIGPWTVSYALLRGFGWLDGSLHGDVAVRRNLQVLLGRSEKMTAEEAKLWLAEFSPWRALVAAHLWAMQKAEGY